MPTRIQIRCFHFDAEGRPKGRGCRRGLSCLYIHPSNPDWANTPESTLTPWPNRRDSNRSPPRRDRSPPRHDRSPPRRSDPRYSRSTSPRRRQDSMGANGYLPYSPQQSSAPRPTSDLPPPPPPLLPPPPALPSTFSSASQSSPAPRLSTRSELKVNWEKILPLIADCVQARKAHQEALDDKIEFGKILGSEYYRKLSETDAAKINEEHERLDEIGKEKGKIVVAKIKSLGETDWWPVGPNEGSADDYRNMVEYAKELAETAKSMHEQYLKNANDLTLPVEPDPRPLKRRRLSDAAVPPMQPADMADLEKLQEKLEALEERIGDIQNQIISFESQTQEDITSLVESRLESMPLDSASGSAAPTNHPSLGPLQQTVQDTSTNVAELTEALAIMNGKLRDLSERNQALENEAQNYPSELEALQQRFQLYEEAHEHDVRQMQALEASLDAVKKRAATPAPLPLPLILSALDEPIRDGVEAAVRPIVEKLARELDEKIEKQDAGSAVWSKLARTFQLLSVIEEVTPQVKPV